MQSHVTRPHPNVNVPDNVFVADVLQQVVARREAGGRQHAADCVVRGLCRRVDAVHAVDDAETSRVSEPPSESYRRDRRGRCLKANERPQIDQSPYQSVRDRAIQGESAQTSRLPAGRSIGYGAWAGVMGSNGTGTYRWR